MDDALEGLPDSPGVYNEEGLKRDGGTRIGHDTVWDVIFIAFSLGMSPTETGFLFP